MPISLCLPHLEKSKLKWPSENFELLGCEVRVVVDMMYMLANIAIYLQVESDVSCPDDFFTENEERNT